MIPHRFPTSEYGRLCFAVSTSHTFAGSLWWWESSCPLCHQMLLHWFLQLMSYCILGTSYFPKTVHPLLVGTATLVTPLKCMVALLHNTKNTNTSYLANTYESDWPGYVRGGRHVWPTPPPRPDGFPLSCKQTWDSSCPDAGKTLEEKSIIGVPRNHRFTTVIAEIICWSSWLIRWFCFLQYEGLLIFSVLFIILVENFKNDKEKEVQKNEREKYLLLVSKTK